MALTSIFRKEPTVSSATQAAVIPVSASGVGNPEANRLALLELLRAWEAARVRPPSDPREKALVQKHLEKVLDRYAQRVAGMAGVASTQDRETALTALSYVRSSVQSAQTVLEELNRLLRGGGSGSSQPAA